MLNRQTGLDVATLRSFTILLTQRYATAYCLGLYRPFSPYTQKLLGLVLYTKSPNSLGKQGIVKSLYILTGIS